MLQECAQREGWIEIGVPSNTDPDVTYVCSLPPWERTSADVSCECEGYIRRGRCSHQVKALALACNWSEASGPAQNFTERANFLCPLCGGQTQGVLD
jgi:hypothetical protein